MIALYIFRLSLYEYMNTEDVNSANTIDPALTEKIEKAYFQIAQVINAKRKEKGLTKVALSSLSGVPPKYIGFIESGVRRPTVETIIKIANALDISLEKDIFKSL